MKRPPTTNQLLAATEILTRAICWNCGKSLERAKFLFVETKTGKAFCKPCSVKI